MTIVCMLRHIVPFGENGSFASMDAGIQYLDFFSYLKDVLCGNQSVFYTFGKTLGGNNIAVFAYYLSSPINLLLIFFEKSNIHYFFTTAVILKIAFSSVTCAVFLSNRFTRLKKNALFVLALGYGMMQYNIAQASNIMWLDGVYMLPLILLGVYRLVNQKKKALLIISVGCSVIFNWYSGAINCLFSAIWFCYEVLLIMPFEKSSIKLVKKHIYCYFLSMAIGLFISAALFFPTVLAMSDGRGSIDWRPAIGGYSWANIFSFIQKFEIGSASSYGSVSLYCGGLAILGVIAYCMTRAADKKRKTINVSFLAFTILLFYIPMFIWVFGLLKNVSSYWYRYSYIGIIPIITIAAEFLSNKKEDAEHRGMLWKAFIAAALSLFLLEYVKPVNSTLNVYLTIFAYGLIIIFLEIADRYDTGKLRYIMTAFLIITVSSELVYNAKLIVSMENSVLGYEQYVNEEILMHQKLSDFDPNFYRTNQTKTRNTDNNQMTANYNESIAFNYKSISGYTSDPDNNQRVFLDKLGYNICGENMNIVNTSILGADSILGVKYVLSDYHILGLKRVDGIDSYNGKDAYYNPYSLPSVFSYNNAGVAAPGLEENNPFIYQNSLFSYLLGRKVEIYKEIPSVRQDAPNSVSVELAVGNHEMPIYGFFDMKTVHGGRLYVNDQFVSAYNRWLAPRVFYVPNAAGTNTVVVRLEDEGAEQNISDYRFYYTDLNVLSDAAAELQSRGSRDCYIENGTVTCTLDAKTDNDRAYISIPFDSGWTIVQNGQKVRPELIGDCMISLQLQKGENQISMRYHVPGLYLGIVISLIGIALWSVIILKERKEKKSL